MDPIAVAGERPTLTFAAVRRRSRLLTLFKDAQRSFVHAGFHPAHPVEPERHQDRLWFRAPFPSAGHDFRKHAVQGHTPNELGPGVQRHRTNLDTGTYFSGRLVADILIDEKRPAPALLGVRG